MVGGVILLLLFIWMLIYNFFQSQEDKRVLDENYNSLMNEARELNSKLYDYCMKYARETKKIGLAFAEIELEGGELWHEDYKPDIDKIKKIISKYNIYYFYEKKEIMKVASAIFEFKINENKIYKEIKSEIDRLPEGQVYKYRI